MRLQHDSGSILYTDADDGVVFYIESHGATANDPVEEEDEVLELSKHFLRQHLIKNGEKSTEVTKLLRGDSIGPLLEATADLHLRKDSGAEESLTALHKCLGVLVSTLQRRKHALVAVEEMQHRQRREAETKAKGHCL